MKIDYFAIPGRLSSICADHVVVSPGYKQDETIAVLADGCSESHASAQGSMILAQAVANAAKTMPLDVVQPESFDVVAAVKKAAKAAKLLEVSPDALHATAILVRATESEVFASIYGDGVLAGRRRDGSIIVLTAQWTKNMPFYPLYCVNDILENEFVSQSERDGNYSVVKKIIIKPDGTAELESNDASIGKFRQPTATCFWSWADYDLIAAFTDGVSSFQDKCNRSFPVTKVVRALFQSYDYSATSDPSDISAKLNWSYAEWMLDMANKPTCMDDVGVVLLRQD